jgi:polyisoprenoid-binding protein YceI
MKHFITRTAIATLLAGSLALGGMANAEDASLSETVPSGLYKMDVTHGYVTFTYSHFGLSNPQVSFQKVDAYVKLDSKDPTASVVDVTIAANSIDSDVPIFNEHLNSGNWLDTEQYPEITFKSTALTHDTDDHTKGTLTGDLTIKGVTKPVSLDVTMLGAVAEHPIKKAPTLGIQATTTVLRSDFELGAYAPAVSDEVEITISGEFNQVDPASHGS